MTLPPRGHPDRIEEMRRRASLGLPLFAGDAGDCVPPPSVPPGSTRPRMFYGNHGVNGNDLVNHPNLRYFGEAQGWWIVPDEAEYTWCRKVPSYPESLPPREKRVYRNPLGSFHNRSNGLDTGNR